MSDGTKMKTSIPALDPQQFQWAWYWLPYHFQPLDVAGKKHVYLPLNRQYKPIGIVPYSPYVKYEDYGTSHAVQFAKDPHTFKGVWIDDSRGYLYLYDDGEKTVATYFQRLAKLCTHKMKILADVRSRDL